MADKNQKQNQNEESDKRKRYLIILLLLLLLITICTTFWALFCRDTMPVLAPDYAPQQNEQNAEKIEDDDSYYENYAIEHDISTEEARRIVTMERKAAQFDAQQQEMAKQEEARQRLIVLRQNAEKTKSQFPQFDLDTEMQNDRFRRLCAANNGDTTAAYMACHWNEILPATVQMATRQIQTQTAQAVASNKSRPIENGLSSQAPSVLKQDYSKMSLADLRKQADEWRRKTTGR